MNVNNEHGKAPLLYMRHVVCYDLQTLNVHMDISCNIMWSDIDIIFALDWLHLFKISLQSRLKLHQPNALNLIFSWSLIPSKRREILQNQLCTIWEMIY